MPMVNIGDGGPPLNIPDQWMPDWQTHVRQAVERGARRRRVATAKALIRQGLGVPTIALRTGLPRDQIARMAAVLRGTDNDAITVADGQHILNHPIDDDEGQAATHPSQWPTRRNPTRRIRIITADHDPPAHDCGLPIVMIRITITPITP